jgi:choline dehydrogenase
MRQAVFNLLFWLSAHAPTAQTSQRLYSNSFGSPFANATYDYVVIGGGNAGLTIATRLAEHGQYSVAVIEAGGFYEQDNGNGSVIPGLVGGQYIGTTVGLNHPLIDWNFITTPQPGRNNESIRYVRGKTLGGCTARNFMAYHRYE